ncbi:cytosolic carboxypeptidase-like protein 5 [Tachyglossus aculeatus]|uniref:cytosolic carboxypeptidase-like protein 5 n=1 Tax=Tachyglossus aculeatus TaxID=9261 RepID=UPI0018F3464F|nr:cytosolic carboxypeptidase-like protein 5 [Tachyglossus aculeatus]
MVLPKNLQPGKEQKVVLITARVHPGETPSSFVCQGSAPSRVPSQAPTPPVRPAPRSVGNGPPDDLVLQIQTFSLLPPGPGTPQSVHPASDHLPHIELLGSTRTEAEKFPASPGVIDFLVSPHPVAKALRDRLVFKIAPMLNPDGVCLGNYRLRNRPDVNKQGPQNTFIVFLFMFLGIQKSIITRSSLMGFDLNRHWLDPSPWAHPTLHYIKQLVVHMTKDPNTSLEFYIDIHAHSTKINSFMYGNIFEDEERCQRQLLFPRLLCQNAPDFSYAGPGTCPLAPQGLWKLERLQELGQPQRPICSVVEPDQRPGQLCGPFSVNPLPPRHPLPVPRLLISPLPGSAAPTPPAPCLSTGVGVSLPTLPSGDWCQQWGRGPSLRPEAGGGPSQEPHGTHGGFSPCFACSCAHFTHSENAWIWDVALQKTFMPEAIREDSGILFISEMRLIPEACLTSSFRINLISRFTFNLHFN